MRRSDARALGQLAGSVAADIAVQASEVHSGIATRVFGALGPAAVPVRAIHDRVAEGAYAGARRLTGAVVRGAAELYGLTRSPSEPELATTLRARLALGALNGAFGDALERSGHPLALPMTIHHRGAPLALGADGSTVALPGARPRLAVFIHGLCETDDSWSLGAARHRPYAERLEAEHDFTCLHVRYNSGRHISHNGRRLSECLEELVRAWPEPVTELVLIGHSMGGLLARSACHYGEHSTWRPAVSKVIMLGTPHLGAPLELAANAATAAVSLLPETRPFVRHLRARSVGVKDLGYGYVIDEDWEGHDPDRFWTNTGSELPFLPSADHYFVSATLTRDPEAPLARAVGDLLVLHSSAWAHRDRRRPLRFPLDRYRHLGGVTHFQLLNHPAVYALLESWLTTGRALPAPAPSGVAAAVA